MVISKGVPASNSATDRLTRVSCFLYSKKKIFLALFLILVCAYALRRYAHHGSGPRIVLMRYLPVPTDVSPQLQALIAVRPGSAPGPMPQSLSAVQKMRADFNAILIKSAHQSAQRLQVTIVKTTLAGIDCYLLTPAEISPENAHRLLIDLHGGGYVLASGEATVGEGILIAGIGHFNVIVVDYRLAPEHPFPAAMDDAIAVWREAIKIEKPENLGILGSSSGGAMVLSLVQRAIAEHLPLPAAIVSGTPWADLTKTGDTLFTNAYVDNGLVADSGFLASAAKSYAHGLDLKDPRISPVYGDFHDFPPTILISGTRDLFLSNTVRVHRKLREADVEADLQVFEGMSHAQYVNDDRVPETREVFREIAGFFGRHLGR